MKMTIIKDSNRSYENFGYFSSGKSIFEAGHKNKDANIKQAVYKKEVPAVKDTAAIKDTPVKVVVNKTIDNKVIDSNAADNNAVDHPDLLKAIESVYNCYL